MSTLNSYAKQAHRIAIEKGWYDQPRNIPELLCLIHSEVSEALDCCRDGHMTQKRDASGKPHGFPTEIADVMIRLFDLCGYLDIDIDHVVDEKMRYNETRPRRHGGKLY